MGPQDFPPHGRFCKVRLNPTNAVRADTLGLGMVTFKLCEGGGWGRRPVGTPTGRSVILAVASESPVVVFSFAGAGQASLGRGGRRAHACLQEGFRGEGAGVY